MTMSRITVSLPARQVEAAKLAVAEGRAANVSAYVSEALDVAYDSLDALVADMIAEFGEPGPEAEAWAAAVLADAKQFREGTSP